MPKKRNENASRVGVVFLLDEYDYPVLRFEVSPNNKDLTIAEFREQYSNWLKDFLTSHDTISEDTSYIYLSAITGVTNQTLYDIASGQNHLTDLTLTKNLACAFGFTFSDLLKIFTGDLAKSLWNNNKSIMEQKQQEYNSENKFERIASSEEIAVQRCIVLEYIKEYYDGLRFNIEEASVYNPHSLNFCFRSQEFVNTTLLSNKHHILYDPLTKHLLVAEKISEGDLYFENIVSD
eukprot:GAHX01000445.1.p1 GENE.GAHX01000445.1~~GAHX01000445.1.p1  ORF type:complete len:235 (-),score=28.72 GAHX01000445.1:1167-1871(-)